MKDAGIKPRRKPYQRRVTRAQVEAFFLSHDRTKWYSPKAVGGSLHVPTKNVQIHMYWMTKNGLLERKGRRNAHRYIVTDRFTQLTGQPSGKMADVEKFMALAQESKTSPPPVRSKRIPMEERILRARQYTKMALQWIDEIDDDYKALKAKLESIL
jgi:hypothetical protein